MIFKCAKYVGKPAQLRKNKVLDMAVHSNITYHQQSYMDVTKIHTEQVSKVNLSALMYSTVSQGFSSHFRINCNYAHYIHVLLTENCNNADDHRQADGHRFKSQLRSPLQKI